MIKLYALSTCPWYKKTKQFFTQRQIPFEFIEVDLQEEKEQEKTLKEMSFLAGDAAYPVTVIDDEVIIGYKPDESALLLCFASSKQHSFIIKVNVSGCDQVGGFHRRLHEERKPLEKTFPWF